MRKSLVVALGLLLVACVSTKVNRLDEIARPPQPPESVILLLQEPDRPYRVIATLESSVDGALRGFDDLRQEMIVTAARLGGDALVLGPETKKTRVLFVPTPIFYDEMTLTAEVVAFD